MGVEDGGEFDPTAMLNAIHSQRMFTPDEMAGFFEEFVSTLSAEELQVTQNAIHERRATLHVLGEIVVAARTEDGRPA